MRSFSDVQLIKNKLVSGDYCIEFHDNSTLTFSPLLRGAQELIEQLPERGNRS